MSVKSRHLSYSPSKINFSTPSNSISTDGSVKVSFFHSILPNRVISRDGSVKSSSTSSIYQQQIARIYNFVPKMISPSESSTSENQAQSYFFDKAFLCSEKHEYDNAIFLYNKLLSLNENHYESLNNLGVCYLKKKLYTEAMIYLEKALRQKPNQLLAYTNKAIVCFEGQMYDQVIETVEKAVLNIENGTEELHKIRTAALLQLGKISPSSRRSDHRYIIKSASKKLEKYSSSPIQNTCRSRKNFLTTSPHDLLAHFSNPSKIRVIKSIPQASSSRKIFSSLDLPSKQSSDFLLKNHQNPMPRTIIRKKPNPNTLTHKKNLDFDPNKISDLKNLQIEKLENEGLIPKVLTDINLSKLHNFYNKNGSKTHLDCEDVLESAKEDMAELKKSIENFISSTVNSIPDIQIKKIPTKTITEDDLEFLVYEFDENIDKRRYDKIDVFLKRLEFFKNYNEQLRKKIYEVSHIVNYRPGEVVFSQGDKGENLYIIIKGSINIIKSSKEFGGQAIIVNSVYDGDHFGDIALINSLKSNSCSLRTATCEAGEDTYVLAIPKEKYQKILIEVQLKSIEDKTCFLCKVPVFKGINQKNLIPLACYLNVSVFGLNDIILKKGQIPSGLHIIMSGHIELLTQGYTARDLFGSEYANARIRKPSPVTFVNANYQGTRVKKEKSKSSFEELYKNSIDIKNPEIQNDIKKFMRKDTMKQIGKNSYLIKDEIPFATLQPYDFFGGRVLLESAKNIEKSKFSVVAKSNVVEIIVIKPDHLYYLSDDIKSQLRIIIEKSYEIDCPDDIDADALDKEFIQWQTYRKNCVEVVRRNKHLERKIKFV